MSIMVVEQNYDKKKNKMSVNLRFFFRVNFVKSVMFFQGKIKNEGISESKKVSKNIFEPLVTKYLSKYQENFVRPIPKTKKKLTKAAKLQMQIEDMEAEHEEQTKALRKDYESQIAKLKEDLAAAQTESSNLNQRFKITIVAFVILVIIYKLLA